MNAKRRTCAISSSCSFSSLEFGVGGGGVEGGGTTPGRQDARPATAVTGPVRSSVVRTRHGCSRSSPPPTPTHHRHSPLHPRRELAPAVPAPPMAPPWLQWPPRWRQRLWGQRSPRSPSRHPRCPATVAVPGKSRASAPRAASRAALQPAPGGSRASACASVPPPPSGGRRSRHSHIPGPQGSRTCRRQGRSQPSRRRSSRSMWLNHNSLCPRDHHHRGRRCRHRCRHHRCRRRSRWGRCGCPRRRRLVSPGEERGGFDRPGLVRSSPIT